MFSIPKSSAFIEGVINLFFTRESNVCEILHLIILPESDLSLEDQREVFAIWCQTNPLPAKRGILE